MKKVVKLVFLLMLFNVSFAQSHYFIYFENTTKQWFTIKLNGKTYQSIGTNFITISKLEKGIYSFLITTQAAKENKFTINIDAIDKGFSIKQTADKNLVLFDINSFETIEQDGKTLPTIEPIKKQEIIVKKKPEKIAVIEEKIKMAIVDTTVADTLTIQKPVLKTIKKQIKKIYNKKNNDGIDQIYIDSDGVSADTIAIFIPFNKEKKVAILVEPKVDTVKVLATNTDTARTTNNSCNEIAKEVDVVNFSIAIQTASTTKNKLKMAGSLFKQKCYTVNQVKRVSVLFVNDSGKFNFFKLSQKSIADMQNFSSLKDEITDTILIDEFKAFLNQL